MGNLMNLWAKPFGPISAISRPPGPGDELPLC